MATGSSRDFLELCCLEMSWAPRLQLLLAQPAQPNGASLLYTIMAMIIPHTYLSMAPLPDARLRGWQRRLCLVVEQKNALFNSSFSHRLQGFVPEPITMSAECAVRAASKLL